MIFKERVGCTAESRPWTPPPLFQLLARLGQIERKELYQTFNMGIGMVLVFSVEAAEQATRSCRHRQDSFVRTAPKRGDLTAARAAASRALSDRRLPRPEKRGAVKATGA